MMLKMSAAAGLLMTMMCLLGSGCRTPFCGSPSLTMLSQKVTANSPEVKVIGNQIEESDTLNWFAIFFMTGNMILSHEAPLQRALDKYHADLLVDAEMETSQYGIPYIFMQFKTTVRGRPAVFVKGDAK